MATDGNSELIMIPVQRFDVNLTLDDILTPLTEAASRMASDTERDGTVRAAAASPQVAQYLQEFSQLAAQLKDVANRINQLAPNLMAPGPRPGSGPAER